MENIKMLDARGLSCPQPAMLTRQVLQGLAGGRVEVLVDSGTARENVSRLAAKSGWKLSVESQPGDSFRLVLTK